MRKLHFPRSIASAVLAWSSKLLVDGGIHLFLGSYMSPETGVEFQNENHVKITVCDLLHVFINLLMLEVVFCVYLYHCKPVDLMIVRYMFIPNEIP